MNRRPLGLKLDKALTSFLHLRQGGGSPQLHNARQSRMYPQTVARPQWVPRVTRVAFDVQGVEIPNRQSVELLPVAGSLATLTEAGIIGNDGGGQGPTSGVSI